MSGCELWGRERVLESNRFGPARSLPIHNSDSGSCSPTRNGFQIQKGTAKRMISPGLELWTFERESPELLFVHFLSTVYPEKLHAVS